MQTSFEVLFILSMIVPVAAVVVGAAVRVGATLLNRQGHAGDAGAPQDRGMAIEHPVGH
jgi:hypothetical protein